MEFNLPKDQHSIIKVIGVGGGGGNAVNYMYKQGIKGVDFIVCNTDNQALDLSPVPVKIQLGSSLTEGRGAGSLPEVGRNAAIENIDEIKEILGKSTKMVFITAGMGGGTGTGAAPVIAQAAKEMGILTVGIVTIPFVFEGRKRRNQAEEGIAQMRDNVDTLLVICNDRIRDMYGNLQISEAFAQADDVLSTAARGIAEIITVTGSINVDFEDVRTVMTNSGVAIMGSAKAQGESRAVRAVEMALSSPLLNDNDIKGANYVLLNITYGSQEVLFDEIADITDFIQDESGGTADVIWGHGLDESLGDEICVTLIATGFQKKPDTGLTRDSKPERKVMRLDDDVPSSNSPSVPTPAETRPNVDAGTTTGSSKSIDELPEPYLKSENESSKPASAGGWNQAPQQPQESTPKVVHQLEDEEDEPSTPAEESSVQSAFEFDMNTRSNADTSNVPNEILGNTASKPAESNPFSSFSFGQSYKEEKQPEAPKEESAEFREPSEDQQRKANERIMRLKELSMKLRAPSGISELENEPAYKRRNIELDDTPHSSESEVSRFTLGEDKGDGDGSNGHLRSNNSFLHDNVD